MTFDFVTKKHEAYRYAELSDIKKGLGYINVSYLNMNEVRPQHNFYDEKKHGKNYIRFCQGDNIKNILHSGITFVHASSKNNYCEQFNHNTKNKHFLLNSDVSNYKANKEVDNRTSIIDVNSKDQKLYIDWLSSYDNSMCSNVSLIIQENCDLNLFINQESNNKFMGVTLDVWVAQNAKLNINLSQNGEETGNFQTNIHAFENSIVNFNILQKQAKFTRCEIYYDQLGNDTEINVSHTNKAIGKSNGGLVFYSNHTWDRAKVNVLSSTYVVNGAQSYSQICCTASTNTSGHEINQNIKGFVADETSFFAPKPELYISTSELVASHGAAVQNKFDENTLYYMQSKGFEKKQIEEILLNSFLVEPFAKCEINEFTKILIENAQIGKEFVLQEIEYE